MTVSLEIVGYLVGNIWMPGVECWKDLKYSITNEQARWSNPGTLRDHVLAATNDGDFQSCDIAHGELIARREYVRNDRRIVETRTWPLERFPSIADCLHDDPDWFPSYPDDEE